MSMISPGRAKLEYALAELQEILEAGIRDGELAETMNFNFLVPSTMEGHVVACELKVSRLLQKDAARRHLRVIERS